MSEVSKLETPIMEISHLTKFFKTPRGMLHAVDDVDFTIYRKKTLGVVGESGCGKTTLGRLAIRLIDPTSGSIYFQGTDITKKNAAGMRDFRKELQIIFQDPFSSLNPRKTVSEIIAEPIKICQTLKSRADIELRVFEMMQVVGLAERYVNSYPHELDGGRRQRIGIARALALDPKFIVCDEPVSALDVSIQAQILNLMSDLQEHMGLTYMFITHDLSVIKHISDEIAVMYLGQCVEKSPAEELFENPLHPYTKALLDAIPEPVLREGKRKRLIKGEVTSPINPKPGCRFAARCPQAVSECKGRDFRLKEVTPGHFAACRLWE